MRVYNQFNECQIATCLSKSVDVNSIMDVGCATGRFYRFFKEIFPKATYRGYDISKVAIDHANSLYPNTEFSTFTGDPTTIQSPAPDLLFCRDVLLHQPNPKDFLSQLYQTAGKYLLMRVRTREIGETELDISLSCQYHYGDWVPYIVFNTKELTNLFSEYHPRPAKIDIVRHPDILGGQMNRFLPKELYYPETGTAETAILVEKGSIEQSKGPDISLITRPEPRGNELSLLMRLAKRLARL